MSGVLDSKEDMEVIAMANHTADCRKNPRAGPERIAPVPLEDFVEIPEDDCESRGMDLAAFGSVCARGFLGLMFLGAVSRELINPWFGLLLAAACFVWAVVCWRSRQHRRRH